MIYMPLYKLNGPPVMGMGISLNSNATERAVMLTLQANVNQSVTLDTCTSY